MTENKRYGFVDGAITDTLTNDRLVSTSEYICELNGLHNLVEKYKTRVWQLKKENEQLKKENELKGDFRNFINEDIVRIKNENERLKKQKEFISKAKKSSNELIQIVHQELLHEGSITLERYNEINDFCYEQFRKEVSE